MSWEVRIGTDVDVDIVVDLEPVEISGEMKEEFNWDDE
jgi:hypothetical protein